MKQTKIVASISDLRCEIDFLRELYNAGVNVMRINTAHATPDGIQSVINNIRAVSNHLAILIDTKGPEIRTTNVEDHIYFKTGDAVKICGNPSETTTRECINVSYSNFVHDLNIGNDVLFLTFFATAPALGLNTVIFPEAYGGNPETGASMAMISHSLCVITIPLIYALMVALFGVPFQ